VPQIGPLEILMLAAVALIVFGPEKLPEIARSVGRFMSEVRRMATDVKSEFSAGLDMDEVADDEDSNAIENAIPRAEGEGR